MSEVIDTWCTTCGKDIKISKEMIELIIKYDKSIECGSCHDWWREQGGSVEIGQKTTSLRCSRCYDLLQLKLFTVNVGRTNEQVEIIYVLDHQLTDIDHMPQILADKPDEDGSYTISFSRDGITPEWWAQVNEQMLLVKAAKNVQQQEYENE